jgi:predicted NACHT family NTPase
MSAYLTVLIDLMKKAGHNKEMSGRDKKAFVIDEIRKQLELPQDIEDLIISLIDILIEVDNGKLVINEKVKNGCLGCYGFLKNKCKK